MKYHFAAACRPEPYARAMHHAFYATAALAAMLEAARFFFH